MFLDILGTGNGGGGGNRTRVRKHYATRSTCLAHSLFLAACYPKGRENTRPASERFDEAAWSTPSRELVSASPNLDAQAHTRRRLGGIKPPERSCRRLQL
jgi:hypothetical protein